MAATDTPQSAPSPSVVRHPDHRRLATALQRSSGDGVGVVRVLDRHGFGTVEPGQLVVGTAAGEVIGELYRGVLDPVAHQLATAAVAGPRVEEVHVGEPDAVAAGLTCHGGATLLAHPLSTAPAAALGAALEQGTPAALISLVDGSAAMVVTGSDLDQIHGSLTSAEVTRAGVEAARQILRRGATATERVSAGGVELLIDLWVPVPSLLVVGAGAIGDALLAQAELLGWSARRETELEPVLSAIGQFTDADVLVLLDHDPAFDAVLIEGVRRGRGFLGALGSRHTQAARRERLLAAGLSEADLALIRGPVGLDLGARTPAETAVSIVAEVIAARSGRSGGALSAARGRIGG